MDPLIAYHTTTEPIHKDVLQLINENNIDWITFTSTSTVNNFYDQYKGKANFHIASIGPITSGAIKKLNWKIDTEAQEYTIDGLIKSILTFQENSS